jgi:ATP-dependent DNA helicase RecQ
LITSLSESVSALVAELVGPAGDALPANLDRLPVELALSVGLCLARCSEDSAGREVASRIFDALRPLAGENVRVDDELARLALAVGQPADAVAILEARLARSEALSANQMLTHALLALGRSAQVQTLAQRLVREAGDRVTTWMLQGEVALAAGDPAAGAAAYQHALELAPYGPGALLGRARVLATQGNAEDARVCVARVFAAYQDAPSDWILREVLEVAVLLNDAAWADVIRARQAELDTRAVEQLRTRIASTLQPSGGSGVPTRRGRFSALSVASARSRAQPDTEAADKDRGDADTDAAEIIVDDASDEESASPELLDALRDHFGYESFLPGQAMVIQAVLDDEDVLAIMPTGAGKSLCYQLPALLLPGTTILISPLIALMKDQLDGLPTAVRGRATVVNSLVDRDELDERLQHIAEGRYKLVYAAPERLRQQSFVYALRQAGVARFVVDEAHCVSLWGHDFRPDYLFIARALRDLSEGATPPPVLALTATATPEVRASIATAIERDLRVVNRGIFRPNLCYEVVRLTDNDDRLRELARIVAETPGAGIVYVRSREGCEEVAEFLRRRCHVSAVHYHAGMERAEREAAQDAFISGRVRVVVATVAFGMGIDKPDVRFIVHYQLPGSLEAYSQESGRAGRDGLPSRCVLFASAADVGQLRRHLRQDELSIETLRAVYATARDLVRAGAPPGAAAGRVAAADLEREVSAAIAAVAAGSHQVDETAARVALSLLERCGFVRRHPDVPRAPSVRMGVDLPIDPAENSAFRAFTSAAHLRPWQFQTLDLVALSAALKLAPAALEERLLRWRDAGLIEYRAGARDLLLEICLPPADGKSALPEMLDALAERHERQVDALVAYTRSTRCRQRVIARHFGEQLPVRACGVCDRCRSGDADEPVAAPRPDRQPRPAASPSDAAVRAVIVDCLRELPYAVGVKGLVRILRGSPDTAPSGQRSPHFGALAALGPTRLTREVQALVAEGALERYEREAYPMLRVRDGR